ncbi:MAG: hypothetical protein L6U99_04405 [Clostridium sp.]|nr:MAG: hypothetical protein L6U99_04405 [Clostridium sp.]
MLLCENEKNETNIYDNRIRKKFISDIAKALYKEETNEVINKKMSFFF